MKLSLKLEYKDKVYTSDYTEVSEEEMSRLIDLVENIVTGKATYLTFKKDNQNYYFGEKVLGESIITITNAT